MNEKLIVICKVDYKAPAPRLYTIKWTEKADRFEINHCSLREVLTKLEDFENENGFQTYPLITNIEVIGEF